MLNSLFSIDYDDVWCVLIIFVWWVCSEVNMILLVDIIIIMNDLPWYDLYDSNSILINEFLLWLIDIYISFLF